MVLVSVVGVSSVSTFSTTVIGNASMGLIVYSQILLKQRANYPRLVPPNGVLPLLASLLASLVRSLARWLACWRLLLACLLAGWLEVWTTYLVRTN
tara:strand:+ start:743 stop:1030 length:288 start_codon:yes stop_codon:yes gene_type:complete